MITEEQENILLHCLGLDEAHNVPRRNNYCVEVPAESDILGLSMVGLLKVGQTINDGRDQYWHATDAGIEVAIQCSLARSSKRELERLSRGVEGARKALQCGINDRLDLSAEALVAKLEEATERLAAYEFYNTCAHCSCEFSAPEEPVHCEDCQVEEDEYFAWQEARRKLEVG